MLARALSLLLALIASTSLAQGAGGWSLGWRCQWQWNTAYHVRVNTSAGPVRQLRWLYIYGVLVIIVDTVPHYSLAKGTLDKPAKLCSLSFAAGPEVLTLSQTLALAANSTFNPLLDCGLGNFTPYNASFLGDLQTLRTRDVLQVGRPTPPSGMLGQNSRVQGATPSGIAPGYIDSPQSCPPALMHGVYACSC